MTTVTTPTPPRHPMFARVWPKVAGQLDRQGALEHRQRVLEPLAGRVVEIGAGDGRNLAHYPATVDEVLAVEPEPRLRARAEAAARQAPVQARVVDGVAERLPLADDSADAAVASLVLCSVTDLPAALAEIRRVLRPGGRLAFFEHVAARGAGAHRVQRALDATVWPRIAGGCHTARATLAAIEEAGLRVVDHERFRFPEGNLPSPTAPHVLGWAEVPEAR